MSDPHPATVVLRRGDHGQGVREIRRRLAGLGLLDPGTPDGPTVREDHPSDQFSDQFGDQFGDRFDEHLDRAVRAFQQQRGLLVDGTVGASTYRALEEAGWRLGDRVLTHLPGNLMSGDDVLALQQRLLGFGFDVGRVDGRFGSRTERGVRDFQRNVGVPADGTCGPSTLKALARLAPIVRGGLPDKLRAEEAVRLAGPHLPGKVVVLDPSVGRIEDPRLRSLADAVSADLATRVEGRLVATGVQALLTSRGGARGEDELGRAEFANRTEADLCLSLQCDVAATAEASGVSTYYYGSDAHGASSAVGERFAGLVQREIVARTGMVDLRSHAKTWDLLRLTRMPAVRIDVGYLTNPGDAARLQDPAFRDQVAEAVVVAVQRVYLAPDADAKTGVLRLSELREAVRALRSAAGS